MQGVYVFNCMVCVCVLLYGVHVNNYMQVVNVLTCY